MVELEKYDIDRDALYENGEPIPWYGVQLEFDFPTCEITKSEFILLPYKTPIFAL